MATRGCKTSVNSFCYVCGYYIPKKQRSTTITKETKYARAYEIYFGISILQDIGKNWVPQVICSTCHGLGKHGYVVINRHCHSQFLAFGVSRKTMIVTVIFVRSTFPNSKVKGACYLIQTLTHLVLPFLMILNFQYPAVLNYRNFLPTS